MNIELYLTEIIDKAVRNAIREELEDLKQEIFNTLKSEYRNATENSIEPESGIIRPKELAKMLSLSISTIYKMQDNGMLPTKIKISSSAVGWLRSDIDDWLKSKKET